MSNISVKFEIKSSNSNYIYSGIASLNRDIISFKDKDDEYYIDLNIKRITKISKKNYMMLDLDNSFIEFKVDGLTSKLDIDIINYVKNDVFLKIKYKLEEEINILLEWSSYE